MYDDNNPHCNAITIMSRTDVSQAVTMPSTVHSQCDLLSLWMYFMFPFHSSQDLIDLMWLNNLGSF